MNLRKKAVGGRLLGGLSSPSSIGPPGISLFTAHTVYIIPTPNWSHVGPFLFLSVCMCSIMPKVQKKSANINSREKSKEKRAKDKVVG